LLLDVGDDLRADQIADCLGVSLKTVYSKRHKIRMKLHSALDAA
jgi:DNA-binding CsgD family transcriptional regulator